MKARLFTDVIDCTLLTEQLGDARAAQANCCGARSACARATWAQRSRRAQGSSPTSHRS
jgi:hypothetical protein